MSWISKWLAEQWLAERSRKEKRFRVLILTFTDEENQLTNQLMSADVNSAFSRALLD